MDTRATITWHVEIRHPGHLGWTHIHHPDAERYFSRDLAEEYAATVRADFPDDELRLVELWRTFEVDRAGNRRELIATDRIEHPNA